MTAKQITASLFIPLYFAVSPPAAAAGAVDGSSAGSHIVTGTTWETLESVTLPATPAARYCMAVCSAEATNPLFPNNTMDYRLAVTSNNVVVGGSDRRFQFVYPFVVPPVIPALFTEVSTTAAFKVPANTSATISCSARKHEAADPPLPIQDSSMSIVCEDFELQNNPALPNVNGG